MERDFGKVTFKGKEYTLTQDAYADNNQDRVCYFANAIDSDGNTYQVRWETSAEWDNAKETYGTLYDKKCENGSLTDDETGELYSAESYLEDESNACNWDDVAEVEER